MDNKITYHEQNDIDNTLKLREVLKNASAILQGLFPGLLMQRLQPRPEFPMHMIFVLFFSFC